MTRTVTTRRTARPAATTSKLGPMPRIPFTRRLGPVGTALLLLDVWRRLPPRQRRWLFAQARKHGPTIVKHANTARKKKR
jgi:hypothetical protein